jgi:hypothetical protein
MTPTEAKKILENPLKFGNEEQIKAVKLLTPIDMELTWDNVVEFIYDYPDHTAKHSLGWRDIAAALDGFEDSVRDEIREGI